MTDFANYRPDAWQVDGLTVPPPAPTSYASSKQNRNLKVAVTAFAIGMAVSSIYVGGATQTTRGLSTGVRAVQNAPQPHRVGDVPDGYWANMIAVLRAAPALPDDDSSDDPAPLI